MRKISDEFCDFKFVTESEVSLAAKIIDGKRRCAFVSASIVPSDANNQGECFLDENGSIVVVHSQSPFDYEEIMYVDLTIDQYYQVKKDGMWGLYDRQGQEVIPCRYDAITWFCGYFRLGQERVKKDGQWGLIDEKGNEIVPCKHERINYFTEGYAGILKDGLWGFIDEVGNEVIPCQYDWVCTFIDGICDVKKYGLWGSINKKGEEVEPCIHEEEIEGEVEEDNEKVDEIQIPNAFCNDEPKRRFLANSEKGVAFMNRKSLW